MQIIIAFVFAFVCCLIIYKAGIFKKCRVSSKIFSILFVLKLIFGLGFYLVYTVHYSDNQTSDMHKYYNDAFKIYELTKNKPSLYLSILSGFDQNEKSAFVTQQLGFWYQEESASVVNDSRMIIRFNLLLLPITKGNIFLHLVAIVFLSFIGLYFIYVSFEKYFLNKEFLLLFACFGIPSVMFWSSGIMKEGLLTFFMGILCYQLFGVSKFKLQHLCLLLLSLLGIFFTKFYVALSLIPSLLFLLICIIFKRKTYFVNLLISLLIVSISAIIFNLLLHNLPLKKLSKKQNDFINLSIGGVYLMNQNAPFDTIFTLHKNSIIINQNTFQVKTAKLKIGTIYHHWKNPGYADTLIDRNGTKIYTVLKILEPTGSAISLKRLEPNYKSVIALLPQAFINIFFRPFINDVENIFSLLACIENLMYILFIIFVLVRFKKPEATSLKIIIFSFIFVLTLYSLVGLTTPVLGAAVRYKVPAIPFLIISLFLLYDLPKINWKIFEK
jgi:hypothetical protein